MSDLASQPTQTETTSSLQASTTTAANTVADIKKHPELWYKLNVFIYDLHNFDTNVDSNIRLEQVSDPSYLGSPYFSNEEATTLKSTITGAHFHNQSVEEVIEKTLDEKLSRRMKKRQESGDYRVCAAHDIGNLMEKMFGIRVKELKKDKKFMKIMSNKGVRLDGESWGQRN